MAALSSIEHEENLARLRSVIGVLVSTGKPRFAKVSEFDAYVTGWAVWDVDGPSQLTITTDSQKTFDLTPDPFHALSAPGIRAAEFRLRRPHSTTAQLVSISVLGETFFWRSIVPNALPKKLGFKLPKQSLASPLESPSTVVIPIHADFAATKACLDSVLRDSQTGHDVPGGRDQ